MSSALRLEIMVAAIMVTCSHGLNIDFSRLSLPSRNYLHTEKRSCQGNPCDPSTPFLCRDSPTCIRLVDICDGKWDCDGGFDEDSALCSSSTRPPADDIYQFLNRESQWIMPMFFNNADPVIVARQLTLADSLESLQHSLGLTETNVQNIRQAFIAAVEGDERPMQAMGMPRNSWPEVKYFLQTLLQNGFQF